MFRKWITTRCASVISSAWQIWWKIIWTACCCVSCVVCRPCLRRSFDMLQLILGGARSGKSALAERLATQTGLDVIYIATSQPLDGEMNQRVSLHRQRRPKQWGLVEEPVELARVLREHARA